MTAAAFKATYSDWKLIRTRKVVQIVLEIPVEGSDQAYQALDGMPNSGEEVWVAVARLELNAGEAPAPSTPAANLRTRASESRRSEPAPGEGIGPLGDEARAILHGSPQHGPKSWHEMASGQQAGILCREPAFIKFLNEEVAGSSHHPRVTTADDAADFIRERCGITSRSDIDKHPTAKTQWNRIVSNYRAWMREAEVV